MATGVDVTRARKIAEYREVTNKVVQLLAERKIKVTQRGAKASVRYNAKGEAVEINLPFISDSATDELLSAIRGFLDHEVAHVLFTDSRAGTKALVGAKLDEKEVKSAHGIINILEDTRIEREMQKRFPGSAANLAATRKFVFGTYERETLPRAIATGNRPLVFQVLLMPLMRAWAGQLEAQEFLDAVNGMELLKEWLPVIEPFKSRIPKLRSTKETADLALEIYRALKDASAPPPPPPPPPAEDGEGDDSQSDDGESQEGDEGKSSESPKESKEKPKEQPKEDKPKEAPKEQPKQDKPKDDPKDEQAKPEKGDKPGKTDEGEETEGESEGESEGEGEDDAPDAAAPPENTGEPEEDEAGDDEQPADGTAGEEPPPPEDGGAGTEEGDDADDRDGSGDPSDVSDEAEPEEGEDGEGEGGDPGKPEQEGAAADDKLANDSDGDSDLSESDVEDDEGEPTDATHMVIQDVLEAAASQENNSTETILNIAIRSGIVGGDYIPYTTELDEWVTPDVRADMVETVDREIAKMDDKMRHMIGQMQGHMRRMFAQQAQSATYGGYRSGRLQASALYRLAASDNRVFCRREEHDAQDTAVTLLVDCSGSMRRAKLRLACHAAYALSQTLERVGIAHEILGFTTDETKIENNRKFLDELDKEQDALGRSFSRFSPITMYVFKAFDERLNIVTRRRLIGAAGNSERGSPDSFPHQVATCANVDGESVMLAALRLLKRREQRKVMIVLSDGYPAAYGIEEHLAEHLKHTVQVIEKMGVEAVGIGIMDESVQGFYPKHVVIDDLDKLPEAVMGQIKRFLIDKRP